MARAVGIDLGTTNSVVAVLEGGEPTVIANAEGVAHHAVRRRLRQERRGARRRGRQAPGGHQRRPHHPLGQAPHGHRLDRRDRRQEVHRRSRSAPSCCRSSSATPRPTSARPSPTRSSPCPAYFNDAQRQATKEAGEIAGPQRAAHRQRADRGRAGLRPRQGRARTHDPRLRPRWRHVRRVPARDRRGRRRGQGHQRRQPPRWRRLGPAGRRLAGEGVQERLRRRPVQGQDGAAAAARGRREGQDRAVRLAARPRSTCPTSPTPSRARCTSTRSSPAPSSRR